MNAVRKNQIARINRQLRKRNQKLRKSRSWGEKSNLGDYHIIDSLRNEVIEFRVNPDQVESDLRAESKIDEFRRLYAKGMLPGWKVRRLEQIPGWSWKANNRQSSSTAWPPSCLAS